ncbi:helix-turn-helix transcriptional regulator [Flavobacterium sp.]|uniref:helix-turn-helix transcriptional regulator n=1 Tax=Flavobacterium sp. TaxID=239 RepID=UPI00286DC725|nr:helix-turn-helix transcriptional regulator [Flavobacterium sp.]
MDYKTYTPTPKLAEFIKCYWTLDSPVESNPEKQRIVPDGCIEMIFHYGDFYKQYSEDGSFIIQPKCFVFGQITQALDIAPTGTTGIFAIRFHPDGFTSFATMVVTDMRNKAVPLTELFGNEGVILEIEMLKTTNVEDKIKIIEAFLMSKLITPQSINNIIKSSIETIMELNGQLSIDDLSDSLKINRRQLERKFSTVIGLSPKQLSKIIRIQATLKMLNNKEFTNLTSIGYESNYYDQAHFIKDFKEFTGISPKKFYSNNLKMSSLFSSME